MRKAFKSLGTVFLVMVLFKTLAFPWGSATHAYIAGRLDTDADPNAVYGSMLPDLFNYAFALPNQSFFHDLTHGKPPADESFLAVWMAAGTPAKRALAWGFLSHNDVWAADQTAHWNARVLPESGDYDRGYIITKSIELEEILNLSGQLGIPYLTALELNHNLLETAGDILITRMDPEIGQKIIAAASISASGEAVSLLDNAYSISGYLGPGVLELIETTFRSTMVGYGFVLTQDEAIMVQMFSGQMRALAAEYLNIPAEDLPPVEVIEGMFWTAINVLESDYEREVRATKGFVNSRLAAYGFQN